ncbi:MAG TPA: hypothetical protein VK139_04550 [Microbacteriaceae bacterium]|nr:hypothetical protein [Microbacteriaceae bacterium]
MRERGRSTAGRRAAVWALGALFTLSATAGTLWALAGTIYSAPAFVARYLELVSSDSVTEALRMPGVLPAASDDPTSPSEDEPSATLLRPGVISSGPSHIRIVEDRRNDDGSHTVTAEYELAGSVQLAVYVVNPAPAAFGLVPNWAFRSSPLAELNVSVTSGTSFSVGGEIFDIRNASVAPSDGGPRVGRYLTLAPAVLQLSYSTEMVVATETPVVAASSAVVSTNLLVLPTPTLLERVQSKLDGFLADCARQTVLQPTGCPFGSAVDDRVVGDPSWSLVSTPAVSLTPESGAFSMPRSPGLAHLSVPVERLYDGTQTTIEQDIEYTVSLVVSVLDDGSIAIQLR